MCTRKYALIRRTGSKGMQIAYILSNIIIAVVVLFHDYIEHDKLSFVHDLIQDDTKVYVSSFTCLLEKVAPGSSPNGIPNIGKRPPPEGDAHSKCYRFPASLSAKCACRLVYLSPKHLLNICPFPGSQISVAKKVVTT